MRNQLSNPISNIDILSDRYNLVETFINDKIPDTINIYLENINDIEKIIRKMEVNIVHPCEIAQLFKSLTSFGSILEIIDSDFSIHTIKELENEPFDIIFSKLSQFINKWKKSLI